MEMYYIGNYSERFINPDTFELEDWTPFTYGKKYLIESSIPLKEFTILLIRGDNGIPVLIDSKHFSDKEPC